jgi:glyoxylase-like metal-dependent hydrolase (beta-lactamase superfamily II)
MCPSPQSGGLNPTAVTSEHADSTCFYCTRLNASTFKIVEDDQWSENPIIYVKIYELVVVLLDTGCGGASRDTTASLTSLRQFLEAYPVSDNNGVPLNQGGTRDYVVVCSHCHFDHIGMDVADIGSMKNYYHLA